MLRASPRPAFALRASAFAKATADKPADRPSASDQFADFRASVVGSSADSVFRFMPIEQFARPAKGAAAKAEPEPLDEVSNLMKALNVPFEVARFEYPRQVRIRRVRVLAPADHTLAPAPGPVIVSRQALGELRDTR